MIERKISATSHGKPQIFLETGGGFKAGDDVRIWLSVDSRTCIMQMGEPKTTNVRQSARKTKIRKGSKKTLIIQLPNDFEVGEYVDLDQTGSYAIIHRRTGKDKYLRLGNART